MVYGGIIHNVGKYMQIHAINMVKNVEDATPSIFTERFGLIVDRLQLEKLFHTVAIHPALSLS